MYNTYTTKMNFHDAVTQMTECVEMMNESIEKEYRKLDNYGDDIAGQVEAFSTATT